MRPWGLPEVSSEWGGESGQVKAELIGGAEGQTTHHWEQAQLHVDTCHLTYNTQIII
jgi:hypothetical protein